MNEQKVLDSQLNYLVSVRVNNNDAEEATSMQFKGIDGLTPDKFTEVYGNVHNHFHDHGIDTRQVIASLPASRPVASSMRSSPSTFTTNPKQVP